MKRPTFSTAKILAISLTALLAILPACAPGLLLTAATGLPEISQVTVTVMPGATAPPTATGATGATSMAAPNPVMANATAANVMVSIQARNFNIVAPGGASGTPGATTPAATASPSPSATATATSTVTATASPTATIATATPGATTTMSPTSTATGTPGATATATPGATTGVTSGHIHYYCDTTVPTTPGVPAVTQTGTYVVSTSPTLTWTNVMPGTHIFSVQLVNNDHSPIIPLCIATAIVTVPAGGAPTATATPGATTTAVPPSMTPFTTCIVITNYPTTITGPASTATANATAQNPQIWQFSAQVGAASQATGTPGAANATAGGRDVTTSCQVSNFNIVNKLGQAKAAGEGHLHFYMDVMIPTDPNAPAVTATDTYRPTIQTSTVWNNVTPGAHAFSAQLANNDHTPLIPITEATIIITIPPVMASASPAATGTPGATITASPTATVTSTPTATASPTATTSPTATASPTAGTATVNLTAQNLAFNMSTITVPAGRQVTVNFNNMDNGIPHNFAVYTSAAATTPIFVGNIITGPATTYTFTAPSTPGSYFFRCDVHPTQMTGTFIVQ